MCMPCFTVVIVSSPCCVWFWTFGSIEKTLHRIRIALARSPTRTCHPQSTIHPPTPFIYSYLPPPLIATPTLSCAPSRSFLTPPCLDVTRLPPCLDVNWTPPCLDVPRSPLLPTRSDVAYRTLVSKTYRLRARTSLIQ